jgi:hypothetical protein
MDGDRSGDGAHSSGEITDDCLPACGAHSGGEITRHSGRAQAPRSGGEIPVHVRATGDKPLATCEVASGSGARPVDVRVDVGADVGLAWINDCWLQQESTFGFSLSKCLRV